jgi:hypothetical protein
MVTRSPGWAWRNVGAAQWPSGRGDRRGPGGARSADATDDGGGGVGAACSDRATGRPWIGLPGKSASIGTSPGHGPTAIVLVAVRPCRIVRDRVGPGRFPEVALDLVRRGCELPEPSGRSLAGGTAPNWHGTSSARRSWPRPRPRRCGAGGQLIAGSPGGSTSGCSLCLSIRNGLSGSLSILVWKAPIRRHSKSATDELRASASSRGVVSGARSALAEA